MMNGKKSDFLGFDPALGASCGGEGATAATDGAGGPRCRTCTRRVAAEEAPCGAVADPGATAPGDAE